MTTVNALAEVLNDVYLNGVIPECVIDVKDDVASILAIDITNSCFVSTSAEFKHKDARFGIGNLSLFTKYLSSLGDVTTKIKQDDNTLIIKPKQGSVVRYVMAQADLIPNYESDWEDEGDMIEEEVSQHSSYLSLTLEKVSEFLRLMGMFNLSSVSFVVDKNGKVELHSGKDTEHQIKTKLGDSEMEECTTYVYDKYLIAVLSAINFDKNPKLYLKEGEAAVIVTDVSSWLLRPVHND